MAPKHVAFWSAFLLGLALDQGTKAWVRASLALREDELVLIPGLLSFIHAENPAAAFGLLGDVPYRYVIFAVFTVVVCAVLVDMYRRLPPRERVVAVSLGLILSGAVGNAIDRIVKRSVTDFVRVYTDHPRLGAWLDDTVGMREWPTFNVADAALVVGVALFLVHSMFVDEDDGDLGAQEDPEAAGDPPAGEAEAEAE